jgi:crotonobetainyl-CoA:carnitine CoA-transferase CaiB-like acyl-CoA transferase
MPMPEGNAAAQAGPLTGVKVADFTSVIAGSYAASVLGDMGADVVKVEALHGDLARHWGPFLAGESRLFHGWNRSKRGISIDMRAEAGREIAYDLIRESDIFLENFRRGVPERRRLDYESVRAVNPQIIYLSISGFGTTGPMSALPGFDPLLQSMSGSARTHATAQQCGRKACAFPHVAYVDFGAALLGSGGILAALYHREKTGEGQKIETSLLQSALAMQTHYFVEALDVEPEAAPGIYPYRYFETNDDVIFIAGGTDAFWQLLCDGLGAQELADDDRFKLNKDRVALREELTEKLLPYFARKTTADWVDILTEKGVPCAPALTYEEFFHHPQVEAMNMNIPVQHAKIGRMRLWGLPLVFDKTPTKVDRPAPMLGEHTDEVLRELGYDDDRIKGLRDQGIIK